MIPQTYLEHFKVLMIEFFRKNKTASQKGSIVDAGRVLNKPLDFPLQTS